MMVNSILCTAHYTDISPNFRSSHRRCSVRKEIFINFAKFTENTCDRASFLNNLFKKRLAQVLSCELCEISKNTISYRTPPVAASIISWCEDFAKTIQAIHLKLCGNCACPQNYVVALVIL